MLGNCPALCLLGCLLCPGPVGAAAADGRADEQKLEQAGVKTDGTSLLEFFRRRTVRADQQRVTELIRQLGNKSFPAREKASTVLTSFGAKAVPQLRQASHNPDAEVRRRAADCLRAIDNRAAPGLVAAAARQLARRKPAGAAAALLDFLPAVMDETTTGEIFNAIAAVATREGKPEPVLLRAVTDASPLRRAAAAVALRRSDRQAVRGLLRDADAGVRLHAALGLVAAGDRDAVPVLIGLFDTLPRQRLWQVEDVLYRLAGDKAPPMAPGTDAAARQAFRDAWLAWWRDRGARTDLAVLHRNPYRDHTLLVLLDEGQVVELDAADKVHFKIDKLSFPLDVQGLPGERVLVAEHGGNRVTERLRDGTILWQHSVDEPLVAQRLANGNTFIASKARLLEVDRGGKEVFSYARPDGAPFMRALKLADGTIACVTQEQQYLRLDATGKELSRFAVQVFTFGGRLDVQPDGRVLIPQMYQHKVVEYDARGKTVREFRVRQPIVAARLANGNTLITSMSDNRAVEFDLAGKQVWQYKANTRVTRAYRR